MEKTTLSFHICIWHILSCFQESRYNQNLLTFTVTPHSDSVENPSAYMDSQTFVKKSNVDSDR